MKDRDHDHFHDESDVREPFLIQVSLQPSVTVVLANAQDFKAHSLQVQSV